MWRKLYHFKFYAIISQRFSSETRNVARKKKHLFAFRSHTQCVGVQWLNVFFTLTFRLFPFPFQHRDKSIENALFRFAVILKFVYQIKISLSFFFFFLLIDDFIIQSSLCRYWQLSFPFRKEILINR